MSGQELIKKKFATWDEAFRGLRSEIRQQSVRVAEYTQVLYLQACASFADVEDAEWDSRLKAEYADVAYKCGLYHQIGKAFLPEDVQLWKEEFSDIERVLYQKYPDQGRYLAAILQEKGQKIRKRKPKGSGEIPTNNISWLMVRESCEQHMERWNGSGYPAGRVAEEISPIAQIVGLAKELDRLVSETKSENPFDEAFGVLVQQAGKEFSEAMIKLLNDTRGKCRAVYRKYIQYTKTLPQTVPLIEKRKERTMGLEYRSINDRMYEAVPWFAGVLEDENKREGIDQVETMLVRTKLIKDVMFYFLYETADTILHMQNCQLKQDGIVIPIPAPFFKGESQLERFRQLFEDQPIDMSKLLLAVPEEAVILAKPEELENFTSYIEEGIQLVVDGYHPEELSMDTLQKVGFSKVRIAFTGDVEEELEILEELESVGITTIDYGVSKEEITEEELIKRMLLGERR